MFIVLTLHKSANIYSALTKRHKVNISYRFCSFITLKILSSFFILDILPSIADRKMNENWSLPLKSSWLSERKGIDLRTPQLQVQLTGQRGKERGYMVLGEIWGGGRFPLWLRGKEL